MIALGEAELILEVRAGNAIALQALLHRYRPRLAQYVVKQMPPELAAELDPEDVVQETCIEAFRRMREFPSADASGVIRWLMTIARHRLVDALRASRAAKRGGGRRVTPWHPDPEHSDVVAMIETLGVYSRTPSQSAAAHELATALARSIASLPHDYQEAIRLRHVDGMPAKEAAVRMNRTEGAFHVLCNRGLKKLRAAMQSASLFA